MEFISTEERGVGGNKRLFRGGRSLALRRAMGNEAGGGGTTTQTTRRLAGRERLATRTCRSEDGFVQTSICVVVAHGSDVDRISGLWRVFEALGVASSGGSGRAVESKAERYAGRGCGTARYQERERKWQGSPLSGPKTH